MNLHKCLKYYNKLDITPQNSDKVKIYKDKLNYYLTGGSIEKILTDINKIFSTEKLETKKMQVAELVNIDKIMIELNKLSDNEYRIIKSQIETLKNELHTMYYNLINIFKIYKEFLDLIENIKSTFTEMWTFPPYLINWYNSYHKESTNTNIKFLNISGMNHYVILITQLFKQIEDLYKLYDFNSLINDENIISNYTKIKNYIIEIQYKIMVLKESLDINKLDADTNFSIANNLNKLANMSVYYKSLDDLNYKLINAIDEINDAIDDDENYENFDNFNNPITYLRIIEDKKKLIENKLYIYTKIFYAMQKKM